MATMLLTTGAMSLSSKVSSQSSVTRDSAHVGWTSSALLPTTSLSRQMRSVTSQPMCTSSSRVVMPVSVLEATRTGREEKLGESYNGAMTSLNPSEVLLEKFANSPPPLETSETEAADRLLLWDDVPKQGEFCTGWL